MTNTESTTTPTTTPTASAPAVVATPTTPSKAKAKAKAKAPAPLPALAPFIALCMAAPRPSPSAKLTLDGVIAWGAAVGCLVADMRAHRDAALTQLGASTAKTSFTATGTRTVVANAIVRAYAEVAKHYAKDDRRAESSASAYRQAKRAFAVLAAITEASEAEIKL